MPKKKTANPFVDSFRHSAPYIHAHRGHTFVVAFSGQAVQAGGFHALIHDLALLHSLGIRLVLVHGARAQIENRLKRDKVPLRYHAGLRVTDGRTLEAVKEAVGTVRVEVESLLSMGLPNTPMSGARLRVTSGNFVTARPLGVRDGVDFCHTGEVRRIDARAIRESLAEGRIVLLSPLGYSPTGEIFNLAMEEVATAAARELGADKLVFLTDGERLVDGRRRPIRQLDMPATERLLGGRRRLPGSLAGHLRSAIAAIRGGVRRVHLVDSTIDGALLLELFTRDGIGTLITAETYEGLRRASIDDVGGILELIEPLEADGMLVRRSRERLEQEIERFQVIERDGMIIACAALYPFPEEHTGELACLAVHPDYRNEGRGDTLLTAIEHEARRKGLATLFVLTTRTAHWFRERGFRPADIRALPVERRQLYNWQRNSKVFVKALRVASGE